MSAKNKGAKGAKTKQRAEKAKPATKLIPELAAMKFPAKMVAKLEALAEADQDTVLNYVNSGMKINDAYQRTTARKPEQQQPEPEAATPAPVVMHCFGGNTDEAALCLDAGCYLGIGGVATFKKSFAVRRSVTSTCRQPSNGCVTINRLAVPLRTYSKS